MDLQEHPVIKRAKAEWTKRGTWNPHFQIKEYSAYFLLVPDFKKMSGYNPPSLREYLRDDYPANYDWRTIVALPKRMEDYELLKRHQRDMKVIRPHGPSERWPGAVAAHILSINPMILASVTHQFLFRFRKGVRIPDEFQKKYGSTRFNSFVEGIWQAKSLSIAYDIPHSKYLAIRKMRLPQ